MKTAAVPSEDVVSADEMLVLQYVGISPECEAIDRDLRAIILCLEAAESRLERGDDLVQEDVEAILDLASALSMKTRRLVKDASALMATPSRGSDEVNGRARTVRSTP